MEDETKRVLKTIGIAIFVLMVFCGILLFFYSASLSISYAQKCCEKYNGEYAGNAGCLIKESNASTYLTYEIKNINNECRLVR